MSHRTNRRRRIQQLARQRRRSNKLRQPELLERRDLLAVQPLAGFEPLHPVGSQVYSTDVISLLSSTDTTQLFEVALDAGQRLSVAAEGEFQANLKVMDTTDAIIADTTAPIAGGKAIANSVTIDVAGVYTVMVSSADGGLGSFSLNATLNAGLEVESLGGPANNSAAEAEDLESTFTPVGTLGAELGAIVGEISNVGPTYSASLTDLGRAHYANVLTFDFEGTPTPAGDLTITVNALTDLSSTSEYVIISAEGLYSENLFVSGGSEGGLSTAQITLSQAVATQLAADGKITFTVSFSSGVNAGIGPNDMTIDIEYPALGGDEEDWHRFSLDDGQSASLVVSGAADLLELYASDGTTLLAKGSSTGELESQIRGFVDATSDGSAEDYFVRVVNGIGQYRLLVIKEGVFADQPQWSPVAIPLNPGKTSLGYVDSETELDSPITAPFNVIGNPLSVGFAADGSFSGSSVGIAHDGIEIINRGTYLAGYTLAFDGQTLTNVLPLGSSTSFPVKIYDVSVGTDHAYVIRATVGAGVEFERVVQWSEGDDFIHVTMSIVNKTGAELSNVAFLENVDADPVQNTTINDVTAGGKLVVATASGKSLGLGSNEPDAVVSAGGFRIDNPFTVIDAPVDPNGASQDVSINMAFDIGNVPVGAKVTRNFQVLLGNGQASVEALFATVGAPPSLVNSVSEQHYRFAATSGDAIQVDTFTPAAGPLQFDNGIDPGFEIVAPDGSVLPHTNVAGDESFAFTASQAGEYSLRLYSENDLPGEYALKMTGATATPVPFTVSASSIADGDRFLATAVPDLTLDFSSDLRFDSASSTDLLIDGTSSATDFTIVDSNTLTFAMPSLSDGSHTLQLPAGALSDLSGNPLEAFAIEILVDNNGPRVVGTSLLAGDVLPPNAKTFTFTFDEPLDESALSPSGVSLVGTRTGAQVIERVEFDAATLTATVSVGDLPEDAYSLTLHDAVFVDKLGQQLDGEADPTTTVPSGDGVVGGDFAVDFSVDTVLSSLSGFVPRGPDGGLVYEASGTGFVSPAGDIDAFSLDLDAGQSISLVVDGDLRAAMEFFDSSGVSLGVASASVAGEKAILQSVPVKESGIYRVEITGGSGTTGEFSLWALLNAQPEHEELGGAENTSAAEAEVLDFTPLDTHVVGGRPSEHAGVTGRVSSIGPTFAASQTNFGQAYYPNVLSFAFPDTPAPVSDLLMTVEAVTDLDSSSEYLTLNVEGLFTQSLFVLGGSQGGLSTTQVIIPQAIVSQLTADGTISFTLTPSSSVNRGYGSGNVTVDLEYSVAGMMGDDWYTFDLQDGEAASIALAGAGITTELYAADGVTLLATGQAREGGGWGIENFVDNTSDGKSEDYFIRVVAGNGAYELVATRNSAFDREGNDSFDTAQDIGGLVGVLGSIDGPDDVSSTGDDDWFVVSLNVGDNLAANVMLPGGGPGEFANPLGRGVPGGLIISEVVDGSAVDGNPKFVEITNTTTEPFTFSAGGLIVQANSSTDRTVDVDLTGVTIAAGESFVIASSLNGGRAAFESIYGFAADLYADEMTGDGNDRYALSTTADGSSILDVYGVLDVDGTGTAWQYTDGYAVRTAGAIAPVGDAFQIGQWLISGVGALNDGSDTPEALLLASTTPGSHDFVPANSPLARIALFGPGGEQVVSNDTSFLYSAEEAGEYRLRVSSLALSGGYFVSIEGATGLNRAPAVIDASVEEGELFHALPTTLELSFSEPLLADEVQAEDLLINGVAGALSVSQIDQHTYAFEIDPAVAAGDGTYTIALPAGAVVDLQGVGNAAYTLTFLVDGTSPIITEALIDGSPLPLGVTYPSGDRTLSVTFNEDMDESAIGAGSFQMIETISNTVLAADAFVYDATTYTLTVDYLGLSEGAYQFVVLDSGVADLAGNILDGEPLGTPLDGAPTGDGTPGGDYVLNFQVDTLDAGTLADFTRLEPLGGLIYASENNPGILNGPGDYDDVVLTLAAGNVVAVSVTPTDPTATLNVAAIGLSGPVSSPAPGSAAVLPAVAMPIDSPLTLRVVGDKPTSYRLNVYLNTSLEAEVLDTNQTTPLAIDNSWITLPESRYAVLGESTASPSRSVIYTQDFNLGLGGFNVNNNFGTGSGLWGYSTGRQLDGLPNHSAPNSLYFGQHEGPLGGGDYETGTAVEGVVTSPVISLPNTGGAWLSFNHLIETDRLSDLAEVAVIVGGVATPILTTADGSLPGDTAGRWESVTADLSDFSGNSIQLQFHFDSVDAIANNYEGWYVDDLKIEAAGNSIADLDEYSLAVVGGVPIDLVLAGQDGTNFSNATLQVIDPISGAVLATGSSAPLGEASLNFDLGILGYTPSSDGEIRLRVISEQPGRYGLVVAAGTVFETEPNDEASSLSIRDLPLGGVGLGLLGGGGGGRRASSEVEPHATGSPASATSEPQAAAFADAILTSKQDQLINKIGTDLAAVYREANSSTLTSGSEAATNGTLSLLQYRGDSILLDAFAEEDGNALLAMLEDLGMQDASTFGRTVSGWMPIDALEAMVYIPGMRFARASYLPMTNVGRTTSQADVSMGSDVARSTFGVDGTGKTIGILSDSYGSDIADVVFGDLPGTGNPLGFTTPVNVLADTSGTDEGRAMAQLVHDVAPGAALAFHTAFNGQADFANGILELQSVAGADVIVDDVIYFAEPMFQDGVIAQAIDTVVANGATYFSSAGNNGRDSWEGSFQGSGEFRFGTELHDFDSGPGVDTMQSITVPFGSTVRLAFQWDSPFFSVSGGAGTQNDLDIYILNSTGTSIVASSTDNNLGGDAVEVLSFTNFTGSSALNIAIGLGGGAAPGLMKWVNFGSLTVNQFATDSATSYGHANAAGAMAIGAVDYRDTPAFGATEVGLETFSSAGGVPTLFDLAGDRIDELRDKPNLVAPDGTNTTFFGDDVDRDGFPNFFGTSAAAPHAAAVAALMQELNPLATPADVYSSLEASAIDMDDPWSPGFDVGFDSGTGAGFIDAVGALTHISVDPALLGPRVSSVSPDTGVTTDLNIRELTVGFSELLDAASANNPANYLLVEAGADGVFGSGGDDLSFPLTPVYDGATTVTLAIGDGSTPLRVGNYQLQLTSGITDPQGNPLNASEGPGTGADSTHTFQVVLKLPSGGDFYEINVDAGQGLRLETILPGVGPSSPANALDAQITVYDPFGVLVGTDQDSADGVNALLQFVAGYTGVYTIQVTAEASSGIGEYMIRATPAELVLSADFNRDGIVNLVDYVVWRNTLGSTSVPYGRGDANGDAVVDNDDYALFKGSFGVTPATASSNQLVMVSSGTHSQSPKDPVAAEPEGDSAPVAMPSTIPELASAISTSPEESLARPMLSAAPSGETITSTYPDSTPAEPLLAASRTGTTESEPSQMLPFVANVTPHVPRPTTVDSFSREASAEATDMQSLLLLLTEQQGEAGPSRLPDGISQLDSEEAEDQESDLCTSIDAALEEMFA